MADRDVRVRLSASVANYIAGMQAAAAATDRVTASGVNMNKLGGTMQNVGRTMTRSVTLPMVAMGGAAVAMSNRFSQTFTRMNTLAGISANELGSMRQAVLDLSKETGRGPQELAEALYAASSSGLDARQSLAAVTIAAKGAASGLGNTQDIISLVASATASYGAANMDAARATDILVGTIREGRADPDELAGSLGRILPVAASLGVSFEEVGGTVAMLSNVFGDTNRTVTSMSGVLNKLSAPTQQGREALEQYGSSMENLRRIVGEDGLVGALQHLRDIGLADDPLALRAMFDDVEAYQGVQAMLANMDALQGAVDGVRGSAGALGEAFAAAQGQDGFKMAQAWAEIQVALVTFGDAIGPIAADMAGAVAQIAEAFSGLPGAVQVAIAGALIAVGPLTTLAGTVMKNAATIRAAMSAFQAGGALGPMHGPAAPMTFFGGAGPGRAGAGRTGMLARGLGWTALGTVGVDAVVNAATNEDGWKAGLGESFVGRLLEADSRSRWNPSNWETSWNPMDREFYIPTYVDPRRERLKAEAQEVAGAPGGMSASRGGQQADGFGWSLADPEGAQGRSERQSSSWNLASAGMAQLRSPVSPEAIAQVQQLTAATQEYQRVVASSDWGQAAFTGAAQAMSSFNSYLFGGHAQVASMEGAMDGLAAALQDVGTIGAGGLNDLNLATVEGRAAFSALQQVAGAWEPTLSQAVSAAGGNVDVLAGSLGVIREDFIQMAVDAGIGADEAAALATAIGLVPENASTLIELHDDEDAKVRLGLLAGVIGLLQEDVQREVAMRIATGDFQGALDLVQANIGETPTSHTTNFYGRDGVSGVVANIRSQLATLHDKTIRITTIRVGGSTSYTTGAPSASRQGGSAWTYNAMGGYYDTATTGVFGEAGPEVILPLSKPARLRELLSDARVLAPIAAAMGGGRGGGGVAPTVNVAAPQVPFGAIASAVESAVVRGMRSSQRELVGAIRAGRRFD